MVPPTGLEPVQGFPSQILSAAPQNNDSTRCGSWIPSGSTLNPHGYTVSRHWIRWTRIVTGFSEKPHFSENLSRTP